MDAEHAFRILDLPRAATEEEIQERYRKLSREHHPDVGGDSDKMAALSEARTIALQSVAGRSLVPASAITEIVKATSASLDAVRDRRETTTRVESGIARIYVAPYKRLQRIAGIFGGISAATTLITSKLFPAVEQAVSMAPHMQAFAGCFVVLSGVYWLVFSNMAESAQQEVEDLSEALENTSDYLGLLNDILGEKASDPPWTTATIADCVASWLEPHGYYSRPAQLMWLRALFAPVRLPPRGRTFQSVASSVGPQHFARLLVAKGLGRNLLREAALEPGGHLAVGYWPVPPGS